MTFTTERVRRAKRAMELFVKAGPDGTSVGKAFNFLKLTILHIHYTSIRILSYCFFIHFTKCFWKKL
jgi:hypothetical protein